MKWKVYEQPPGPVKMGYKGVSYMGCEITRNGKILDKEDDIKDGDTFNVFNESEWIVDSLDSGKIGRLGDTFCSLEFAKDDRKCWVAAGFCCCPYNPLTEVPNIP